MPSQCHWMTKKKISVCHILVQISSQLLTESSQCHSSSQKVAFELLVPVQSSVFVSCLLAPSWLHTTHSSVTRSLELPTHNCMSRLSLEPQHLPLVALNPLNSNSRWSPHLPTKLCPSLSTFLWDLLTKTYYWIMCTMLLIHLTSLLDCVIQFCTICLTLNWTELSVQPYLESTASRKLLQESISEILE